MLSLKCVWCILGFTNVDGNRVFHLPLTTSIGGAENMLTLSEIKRRLSDVYCKHIGLEYMHINDRARCELAIVLIKSSFLFFLVSIVRTTLSYKFYPAFS